MTMYVEAILPTSPAAREVPYQGAKRWATSVERLVILPPMHHSKPKPGEVVWRDLTVVDAKSLRDFYAAVVGWKFDDVEMGGYADYAMRPPGGGEAVAGVCHARGVNANLPAHWLIYVLVSDLTASLAAATARGGSVVDGPRPMGEHDFAVVRDPAGAYLALLAPRK